MAACRAGDTLVVTKLDRLARSLSDARDIADELTAKGVVLSLGGNSHDPTDPVGRLLFNVLGMVAEFEADLIRVRTREGMAVAKAKGRLKGKQPKLSKTQRKHLLTLHEAAPKSHECKTVYDETGYRDLLCPVKSGCERYHDRTSRLSHKTKGYRDLFSVPQGFVSREALVAGSNSAETSTRVIRLADRQC